jgi:hypothetical protein
MKIRMLISIIIYHQNLQQHAESPSAPDFRKGNQTILSDIRYKLVGFLVHAVSRSFLYAFAETVCVKNVGKREV